MAWLHYGRWFLFSGLLVVLSSCASAQPAEPPRPVAQPPKEQPLPPPAPVRAAPTRPPEPKLWPVTILRGAEYIDVREIARRFGLKAEWVKGKPIMTIGDRNGVRCTIEDGQNDYFFDGVRVFLGKPVLREKDTLWISKLDVIKLVEPLFAPANHSGLLPANAPRVIVIDAGHGGIDPGTQNLKLGLKEKTFTLDVAHRLSKILTARGWEVLMIRTDDRELSKDKKADLLMRNEFANKNKADLFLSIHFNSAPEAISGIETYTMAPQFMFSTGDEQGDDMTKTSYPSNRLDNANLLFGEMLHRALLQCLKTPDRGFKRGRRAVLRMLDCPGALVECGYISNDTEARRIATPEFRQKIAEALAVGLQNYAETLQALHPKTSAPPSAATAPSAK